ncbi:MAG TPA: nucleotidyltransferase domain-containing protein [Candidatus Dojkabacteria bacterium]|nr:nucleotidyltransferase domain-containing protein [Candidatus Dojkabacteria bacterium]
MNNTKQIKEFLIFRNNIGVQTSKKLLREVFGEKMVDTMPMSLLKTLNRKEGEITNTITDEIISQKLNIVKTHLSKFLMSDWVKYIAVTGSIASGAVRGDDDIDIFVVVKNNTMWIYRALLLLKLKDLARKEFSDDSKNLFCLNLIAEERGLEFPEDIFNFHELYTMIPVYNLKFKKVIFSKNKWIENWGGRLSKDSDLNYVPQEGSVIVRVLNTLAFVLQYIYMKLKGHNPDKRRISKNNKIGRIEFFHEYFKQEKLSLFNKSLGR